MFKRIKRMFCSYRPKEIISFVIKTLQSTISTNNGKRRRNVSQCSQHNCIGPICNLRRTKKKISDTVTHRHRGGSGGIIYPYYYWDTQISLSSFVRSHMVSWEAGLGLVLRTVTKACVCFHGDAQRYRTDSGCWPLTLSRHNQLLQNPRLSRTMSSRGQMLDRIKLMPLKLPRFYNPL